MAVHNLSPGMVLTDLLLEGTTPATKQVGGWAGLGRVWAGLGWACLVLAGLGWAVLLAWVGLISGRHAAGRASQLGCRGCCVRLVFPILWCADDGGRGLGGTSCQRDLAAPRLSHGLIAPPPNRATAHPPAAPIATAHSPHRCSTSSASTPRRWQPF